MAAVKKYNLAGAEVGEVTIAEELLQPCANPQMIKDYIVAYRANQRQWSANTKTRAEVCHSGKKPHPQKGTGRARQGSLASPQYKGGGRVFTPKPKFDQHVSLNRKEKRAAVRQLLIDKVLGNHCLILEPEEMNAPKTKRIKEFLRARGLEGKRVLVLAEGAQKSAAKGKKKVLSPKEKYQNFFLSMRNVPKVEFQWAAQLNGYEIALNAALVVMEPAVDELMTILGKKE